MLEYFTKNESEESTVSGKKKEKRSKVRQVDYRK